MLPAPPPAAAAAVAAATQEQWATLIASVQAGTVSLPGGPPSAPPQSYKIPKRGRPWESVDREQRY